MSKNHELTVYLEFSHLLSEFSHLGLGSENKLLPNVCVGGFLEGKSYAKRYPPRVMGNLNLVSNHLDSPKKSIVFYLRLWSPETTFVPGRERRP